MFFKYSDIVVEVQPYAGGFSFLSPFTHEWISVEGDLLHCRNRIHQHLHVEHGVPLGTTEPHEPLPNFDLGDWLERHHNVTFDDRDKLLPVFVFPILWNLFERNVLVPFRPSNPTREERKKRDVVALTAFASDLKASGSLANFKLEDVLKYFVDRYSSYSLDQLIYHLLPDTGREAEVEDVELLHEIVQGRTSDPGKIAESMLFIAYRIRNNYFHGIKSVANLESQADLFNAVNVIISRALDVQGLKPLS